MRDVGNCRDMLSVFRVCKSARNSRANHWLFKSGYLEYKNSVFHSRNAEVKLDSDEVTLFRG